MDDNPNISAEGADTAPEGNTHSLPPNDLSARYQFFYNDISRYCNDMWAIIASVRHRAVEHVIFSASLLGLYLAFDAASNYYKARGLWFLGAAIGTALTAIEWFV